MQEQRKLHAVATWENTTCDTIEKLSRARQAQAIAARRATDVETRREKLRVKLSEEEERYKRELLASESTAEQRRAALADRARQQAAAREAERKALAEKLLQQQFQEVLVCARFMPGAT